MNPLVACPIPHVNGPLAERLVRLIHVVLGTREDHALFVDVLENAIERHFVDDDVAPAWMIELLDRLLAGQTTYEPIPYPIGYPEGEGGLVNVLANVEHLAGSLGIDDEGEYLEWPLPRLGVCLHLEREGACVYRVRPCTGPWAERSWAGGERRGNLVDGWWAGVVQDRDRDGRLLREVDVPPRRRSRR